MANETKEAPRGEQKPTDGAALGAAVIDAVATKPGGVNLEKLLQKAETRISCLVLGAEAWNYEEKGIKGTKVHWAELGADETDKRRGWIPKLSKSSDFVAFHQLREFQLPGYFSARVTVVKDGIVLSDFEHVADLEAS